jgi:hypothetical protein
VHQSTSSSTRSRNQTSTQKVSTIPLYSISQTAQSLADLFAKQAEIANKLLQSFSLNHRRHRCITLKSYNLFTLAIFEFSKDKYETNSKGLLRFRTPNEEEIAVTVRLPPPERTLSAVTAAPKPPPPIDVFPDRLKDLGEVNREWEEFVQTRKELQCEKISNTQFQVTPL